MILIAFPDDALYEFFEARMKFLNMKWIKQDNERYIQNYSLSMHREKERKKYYYFFFHWVFFSSYFIYILHLPKLYMSMQYLIIKKMIFLKKEERTREENLDKHLISTLKSDFNFSKPWLYHLYYSDTKNTSFYWKGLIPRNKF